MRTRAEQKSVAKANCGSKSEKRDDASQNLSKCSFLQTDSNPASRVSFSYVKWLNRAMTLPTPSIARSVPSPMLPDDLRKGNS